MPKNTKRSDRMFFSNDINFGYDHNRDDRSSAEMIYRKLYRALRGLHMMLQDPIFKGYEYTKETMTQALKNRYPELSKQEIFDFVCSHEFNIGRGSYQTVFPAPEPTVFKNRSK